jgi:hypothetical protein
MPHTVLITTHPDAALAKACLRGSWVPLLLLAASVAELLSSGRASTAARNRALPLQTASCQRAKGSATGGRSIGASGFVGG